MKKTVQPQSVVERLLEIDTVILKTCQDGSELLRIGAPVSEVDATIDFLRKLYNRRDVILVELKKAGLTEKLAYESVREKNGKGGPKYELDRYMVQGTVRTESRL